MKVTWKKNKSLKPNVIFKKIDDNKTVVDGKVSFSGFEYHDAIVALETMINFPPIADDLDKDALVKKTVWKVAKEPKIELQQFISELDKNIRLELAKRNNIYYLLTSLSLTDLHVRKIVFQDCIFNFYKNDFPGKFKGRVSLIKKHKPHNEVETQSYTKVVIELKAKSESIAANKAMKMLDLLRSLLVIYSNSSAEIVGNNWEPINKIRLGEFHTVHDDSGDIFDKTFWYDPSFSKSKPHVIKNEKAVIKNVRAIINRLSKFERRYNSILCDGLLRFVRAFDEKNQNIAVLRVWGALESVAAPNESNCDSVTTRCSFLFEDYEYHKQILEHLREYRNRNVHAGQESATAKSYGFQIQRYFIQLFLFHIRQQGDFDSIEDANKFLDLPADETKLMFLKKMVYKSLKFRGYLA